MPQITLTDSLAPGTYNLTLDTPAPVPTPQPIPTPIPAPAPKHPVGKGYYIWNIKNCGGGSPARIVELCLSAGIKWVTIKLHDGPNEHSNTAKLQSVVTALKAAGIAVWGWGYEYAIKPADEARRAIEMVRRFDLAGYMIDVESEYKDAPGSNIKRLAAIQFCDVWHLVAGESIPVGLASYRYPILHPSLAWDVFAKIITFHNPQVYWMGTSLPTAPTSQLIKSIAQLKAIKDVPIIPIGVASSDDTGTWRPTVAQLDNFAAGVKAQNLLGVCWWSWEHAEREPLVWAAVARHP